MISEYLIPKVAVRFKAMSDPGRLRLLSCLSERAHGVSELVERTGRPQPSVSQSLAQLLTAGLVASRRDGSRMIYSLSDPYVARICDAVCRSISENAEKQAKAIAVQGQGKGRRRA